MSTHPTIAALRAALESEREYLSQEKTLPYKSITEAQKRLMFKSGHKAATERLLGLLEKAVEMSDNIEHILKYADREFGWLELLDGYNKQFLAELEKEHGDEK